VPVLSVKEVRMLKYAVKTDSLPVQLSLEHEYSFLLIIPWQCQLEQIMIIERRWCK
jgi:hypothetical protein